MNINTDINILGGLTDWGLMEYFISPKTNGYVVGEAHLQYSNIKTEKSVARYERAVRGTLLHYRNTKVKMLIETMLEEERLSTDSLLLLFWNSSCNNDLFNYLNAQVFFPAFYSGKLLLKKEEANACLMDLRKTESSLQTWSLETIDTVARKYLSLLKNFNLLTPKLNKAIIHPYLNDKMYIQYVYWLLAIDTNTNLLESKWLDYSFCERSVFIERLMQKKFAKYFQFNYTGDKLKIETTVPYEKIYHALK